MTDQPVDAPEISSERGSFRAEYERELGQWLRRRLGWLCITYAIFHVLGTLMLLGSLAGVASDAGRTGGADALGGATEPTSSGPETAPRVLTPLDAVVEFTRGVQAGVQAGSEQPKQPQQPIGRLMDRWFDENIRPIAPGQSKDAASIDASAGPRDGDGAGEGVGAAESLKTAESLKGIDDLDSEGDHTESDASPATEADGSAGDVQSPVGVAEGAIPASPADGSAPLAAAEDPLLLVPWWVWLLLSVPPLATIAWFGLVLRPRLDTRSELVAAATKMILALGFITFTLEAAILIVNQDAAVAPIVSIWFWHLTASLFLPWNWRESLRPIVPLFVAWVLLRAGLAVSDGSWISFALAVVFAPLLFLPATVLCYVRLRWHRNRFKSGFVGRRFLAMRREFLQARAVHESLFPAPIDTPWFRFAFAYRPAADIGGDFVHAWTDDDERLWVAIIDVTGHGLASAMSVARIHGELERLRDEHPEDGPGKLLARLNRYFRRLLARHNLFATAIILRIDHRRGELRYANAGHPPMFLRSRGEVRELDSTTFLLGAVDDADFGDAETTVWLEERDTLVLFTDGAHEARNPAGKHFGLDRLREILRQPAAPPAWPPHLLRLVETFEAGKPEDDLLVAEIVFKKRLSMSSGITGDAPPEAIPSYAGADA